MFEKKSPTCKQYLEKEFKDESSSFEDDKSKDSAGVMSETVKIGFKWNKFGKAMKKLMDEDFWLNSPEDCGIHGSVNIKPVVEKIQNKSDFWNILD